jgi:hypothetical protein
MLEKKEKQEVHVRFPIDSVFFKMRIEPEEIKDEILNLDINTITPMEALMKLNEIKRMLSKK